MSASGDQRMKPITAAKKLGIYLPAAPEEFQSAWLTRAELAELERHPPEWLQTLRREGPHPRPVVAGRLAVSIAGLIRSGADEALTTAEIDALRAELPAWLEQERQVHREVQAEEERVRRQKVAKAARKPRR
ncbi:MAG TPA: hypothetical protein H9815_09605 [Candidatus Ruania gallistercoris]|uniref:Uncharacterized protein n=1 Tax=Candidatus Ruania gallistercoris TaxID=2838746 RepID=A0A9D2J3W2_9MICO|nr:hypothetical protein [Candidatus Ruania gallistercoris]